MHSHIDPALLGQFTVTPLGKYEIASFHTFVLTVKLGVFGMDDRGSIRFVFHGAKDYSQPQSHDPAASGYVSASTSTGKSLSVVWAPFLNERPWFNTLEFQLIEGGLAPGDEIRVVLGDTSGGSPGFRLQTYCQDEFKFRALINPFSTQQFFPMAETPVIEIGPADPHRWEAVLPTARRPGETFRLSIKSEDIWGNPTDKGDTTLCLHPSLPVAGLPARVEKIAGQFSILVEGLGVSEEGDLTISVSTPEGEDLCRSNPLRVRSGLEANHFWGDLHGQSGETIGTNSAWRYFEFARDKAFLDICSHQGNDFQIRDNFWSELNRITAEFNEPGRFLAIPGYEWSGNSALGGDRNVWFKHEGGKIRRAHRALVPDAEDCSSDRHTARALFQTLIEEQEDVCVAAHCGGRYADLDVAHDGRVENSLEIHSVWGTFEWLLKQAFDNGYRMGIVGNSDGHKGRPGASYPGDSFFTSKGGYTCFLMDKLDRDDLFEAMRRRHHYATTGTRLFLSVGIETEKPATLYHRDPSLFPDATTEETTRLKMGDIAKLAGPSRLSVSVTGSAPLERVEVMESGAVIHTERPNPGTPQSRRLLVLWRGAKYRGRGRNMKWQGRVRLAGNVIETVNPVNFWSPESQPTLTPSGEVTFCGVTGGNIQGLDILLTSSDRGVFSFESSQVNFTLKLAELVDEFNTGELEGLEADVRVIRIAEDAREHRADFTLDLPPQATEERRVHVRVTQVDGHQAWSSPMYLLGS
jgi:hypothetical protein